MRWLGQAGVLQSIFLLTVPVISCEMRAAYLTMILLGPSKKWRTRSKQGRECRGSSADGGAMNVIALTAFIGLVLVSLFGLLFVVQFLSHPPGGGQEALLPLADETEQNDRKVRGN